MNCCFMFADEAFFAGDRAHESMLKAIITEPRLRIEMKGIDMFQMPNRISLVLASNSDWVVPATRHERRFFVLDMPVYNIGRSTYWAHLHAAINDRRTLGAFLRYLLERDLSKFDVRRLPYTAGLDEQKHASLDTEERWLLDLLDRGSGLDNEAPSFVIRDWETEISFDKLFRSYEAYTCFHGKGRYAMHRVQLGQFLSKYYPKKRLPRPADKAETRGWAYVFGPLEEARERFNLVHTIGDPGW
jgi:hypothetical protein